MVGGRPKEVEDGVARTIYLAKSQWDWIKAQGSYSAVLRELVAKAQVEAPLVITKAPETIADEELSAVLGDAYKGSTSPPPIPQSVVSKDIWDLVESTAAEYKMGIEELIVAGIQQWDLQHETM